MKEITNNTKKEEIKFKETLTIDGTTALGLRVDSTCIFSR
jgi:hypothetical protein